MIREPKTLPPEATLAQLREQFESDHMHMALVVGGGGELITTIERADLTAAGGRDEVVRLGGLDGRTVDPGILAGEALLAMAQAGRRRLAVVDDAGRLVGLLCLKRRLDGFCSEADVRERQA
jgi:CBS domain-containing protein